MRNQLRIGNLVTDKWYDSFKTIIEVESIDVNGINLHIEDDGNWAELAQHSIVPDHLFGELEPIQLTKEWLLKFGFYEIGESLGFFDGKTCFEFDIDKKRIRILVINNQYLDVNHIKSVHQLQNLYFALTNKELTIKN